MLKIGDLNPQRLYVIPLGVGNAFTRVFYNSSLLVVAGGRVVLIDCPSPLRRVLHEASKKSGIDIELEHIDHAILTHLHADHAGGLEEFAYYKQYIAKQSRPHLYLLEELIGPLWENRLKAAMGGTESDPKSLATWFQAHRWTEGQRFRLAESDPDLEFEVRRTRHSVPCIGLKIHYGMYTFGYSGDTEFDQDHIDFLSGCDFIVHEAGGPRNHTALSELQSLPKETRAKMALIHVPDDFRYFESDMPVLSEGAVYEASEGREPIDLTP